jgi:hypothetical protein
MEHNTSGEEKAFFERTYHWPLICTKRLSQNTITIVRDILIIFFRTPISKLYTYLQMIPIPQFIYKLTDKFFVSCPAHQNPLICKTGNYTLEDLHRQYPKYRHKRIIKHILL